jgi:uncharacterized SAM-binding protein YcdF (DUF218 family)
MKVPKRAYLFIALLLLIVAIMLHKKILRVAGEFLVFDEAPTNADAIVVLYTGVEYYPRLMEAADLYRKGYAKTVVINGNRKSDQLRAIEASGFETCCPWYEDYVRILSLFGVPRESILAVSAEDVYDTTSEAEAVGSELLRRSISRIILTTSKYHTRRAHFIWERLFNDRLTISMTSAKSDPYDPTGWWKEGRQIRWVLAEYGAWVFYYWKQLTGSEWRG